MLGRDELLDKTFFKRVSKAMALLLRHAPDRAGLILDPEGFVHIDDLVGALRTTMPDVDAAAIHKVVETVEPHKQRYSIVDGYVRANYGHSTAEQIRHQAAVPPPVLYHGTSEVAVSVILASGIKPMRRQYVHLTADRTLAASVGSRHGRPRVIEVDARSAHVDGIEFFKANFTFWLATGVPPIYLRVEDDAA